MTEHKLPTHDDEDSITITTQTGATVQITADTGTIYADVDADDLFVRHTSADLTTKRGTDVLDLGTQTTDDGNRDHIYIPVTDHVDAIKTLREDSLDYDTPLTYDVQEGHKKQVAGTELYLAPTKARVELTDEQRAKYDQIDDRADVPDDAEVGDELHVDDLLNADATESDDTETEDDSEDDESDVTAARDAAAERGERVEVDSTTVACDGSEGDECSQDRVTRYATPDGDIETERTHFY